MCTPSAPTTLADTMTSNKIVSLDELVSRRVTARENGLVVVLTNGCFDILHMGHVTYLHQARKLGDMLWVAVNSDRSGRELKGPQRPINAHFERAGVLAALEDVDAVTIFDDETAVGVVERIQPDVYVKGGDYSQDQASPAYPIEGDTVRRYGGVVRVVPFAAGYSTTRLIERLRRLQGTRP